jgi:hypothetical protein
MARSNKKGLLRTKRRRTTKRRRSRKKGFKTRAKRFLPRRLRGGSESSESSEERKARVLAAVQAAGMAAIATVPTVAPSQQSHKANRLIGRTTVPTVAPSQQSREANRLIGRTTVPTVAPSQQSQQSRLIGRTTVPARNSELNAEISLTEAEREAAQGFVERSKVAKQERGDLALAQALSMAPGSFRGGPSQMSSDGQVKARVNQDYLEPSFASAMPCKVDDVVTFLGVDGEWARVKKEGPSDKGKVGWVPYSFLEFKRAEPDPDEIAAKVCEAYYRSEIYDYILPEKDVALINQLFSARQERDAQGITMDELNEYLWNFGMRSPIPGSDDYTQEERGEEGSVMSDEAIRRGLFLSSLTPEFLEHERSQQDHVDTSPLFIYSERAFLLKRQELEKDIAQRIKDAVLRGENAIEFTMTLHGRSGKPFYRGTKEALR